MGSEDPTVRIGELAERAGVNVQTVRYYERRGLLARPARSTGGHRAFDEDSVALLRGIKAAQRLGFTLSEIEEMAEFRSGRRDGEQVRTRAATKIREIDERVQALLDMREVLERVVHEGCGSLIDCASSDGCPIQRLGHGHATTPR